MSQQATLEIPDKLVPVFSGEYRFRGAYGGRGSAKTRTFALMTAVKGYQFAESGINGQILCGREFMNSLSDSSFAEVKAAILDTPWLADYYDCGDRYIKTKNGRVVFTFAGLRRSLDSIKSKSRILLAWIDEADPVTEEAWVKLIPTVREDDSEVWVTWNPERKNSATDLRFRKHADDDMIFAEVNWRDNPWFPKTLDKERRRDKAQRPEIYEHIWEGGYLDYVTGSYYSEQMRAAYDEGRVRKLPKLPGQPCATFWDIGSSDGCAIFVVQVVGKEIRVCDFYESWGKPYSHAVQWLQTKGYIYEEMFLPHDASHERQGKSSNKSPQAMLQELMPGLRWTIVPRIADINWGIQQTRDVFPQLWFDAENCEAGIEHIKSYRRKWSENEKRWLSKPDKTEGHSEAADALRQLGQAIANKQYNDSYDYGQDDDFEYADAGWMA